MPKRETILLADDESAIRRMLCSILESRGFHVLQAKNGKEGLEAAAIHEGPIHLLISDMQMPGLNGPELAAQLQAVRPGLRVILMSGDDESVMALKDEWIFLNKPFEPTEFIDAVNEVLRSVAPSIRSSTHPISGNNGARDTSAPALVHPEFQSAQTVGALREYPKRMDPKTAAMLANPAPGSHIVFSSSSEEHVATAIAHYAASGLEKGEAVILITTDSHRRAVLDLLKAEAYNVERLESNGQMIFLDAAALLAEFTVNGIPNSELFKSIIDRSIKKARRDLGAGRSRGVRAFGEMVSLLWNGNPNAALGLEKLWNDVVEDYQIPLLCTYSLNSLPSEIAGLHSHSFAA